MRSIPQRGLEPQPNLVFEHAGVWALAFGCGSRESMTGPRMSQAPTNQPPPDDPDDRPASPGWMPAKHPAWAFALSFFFPGTGLVYLGKPLAGLVNFAVVVGL